MGKKGGKHRGGRPHREAGFRVINIDDNEIEPVGTACGLTCVLISGREATLRTGTLGSEAPETITFNIADLKAGTTQL